MKQQTTGLAGAGHGSLKGYLIGFALSLILTVIPFLLVMHGWLAPKAVLVCIVACAVIQIVVHLYYFLQMNSESEEVWNMVALVFTLLIIAIVVVGSLWIMYNLNVNMMPS
jgi:cytochrome o ubiquinol oxidase operon protein cyoD